MNKKEEKESNTASNKLLLVKSDRLFKDLFNENEMDTLEWAVMQILNTTYEKIHGKVTVANAVLNNTYPNERSKTVDLLVDYEGVDVLIELNNNYGGNYMRNLLYAFNIILNHYQKGTKDNDLVKKRAKLILVNLNWYPIGANYTKIPEKVESYLAYPEDNTNDYIIRTISINLDRYKNFCYDEINEWDKLWKLLTIEDDKELEIFTKNEKLLKRYEKKLFNLSQNKEYSMILMDEEIERNALMAQSYQGGYRTGMEQGLEQGINQMIMNMYKEKVPVEVISKCANLDISDVKRIIEENSKEN